MNVEQDFHKPLQKLTQKIEATSGKAELKGSSLKKEVLTRITQSIASKLSAIYSAKNLGLQTQSMKLIDEMQSLEAEKGIIEAQPNQQKSMTSISLPLEEV